MAKGTVHVNILELVEICDYGLEAMNRLGPVFSVQVDVTANLIHLQVVVDGQLIGEPATIQRITLPKPETLKEG